MEKENVNPYDRVSRLEPSSKARLEFRMDCISPEDGKYGDKMDPLRKYLTAGAEWKACALVQRTLLETRVEYGQAQKRNLEEVDRTIPDFDPVNASLLEEVTQHDQLAVIEEMGRRITPETKALLHPGTTSYDVLDTARSYLFREAWKNVIRPEIAKTIQQLVDISEKTSDYLQVGRTHLQDTSPVPFGTTMAGYAARLAERLEQGDKAFRKLKGKISGIVGTGASIDMVLGEGTSLAFERAVLAKLGLEPDLTATQIVQKEALTDVGHSIVSLVHVLGDLANDTRMMYSSAIGEVTSRDSAERLGGSSADAGKNNPINYENIGGTVKIVESGMGILYSLISSDFQRDLRGSKPARYQPGGMMAETFEAFKRLNKSLPKLSINTDTMEENLQGVRDSPTEAMTAILRGESGWVHPIHGVGHDFVKVMARKAKKEKRKLMDVALQDEPFRELVTRLPLDKIQILEGKLELYTGSSRERAEINRSYARRIIKQEF